MTQITIRHVDDDLAERIRRLAKQKGEPMNSLILRMLKLHFSESMSSATPVRNSLSQKREGWIEDPAVDEALEAFGVVDDDDWK